VGERIWDLMEEVEVCALMHGCEVLLGIEGWMGGRLLASGGIDDHCIQRDR